MKIEGILVERVSKAGNAYTAVELQITDKLKKLVFLSPAEIELLKLSK